MTLNSRMASRRARFVTKTQGIPYRPVNGGEFGGTHAKKDALEDERVRNPSHFVEPNVILEVRGGEIRIVLALLQRAT